MSDRQIARAVGAGELVRVALGVYADGRTWNSLFSEDRHLLKVLAAAAACRNNPVFSYYSAAVLHDLPLFGFTDSRAHITQDRGEPRTNSSSAVVRHREPIPRDSVVEIAGIQCTDLPRTAIDIARAAPPELALGCADAVLARVFRRGHREGVPDTAGQRRLLLDPLRAMRRSRGIGHARSILGCTDARAESPLESVSRWYLVRLGFDVAVQVPVRAPDGGNYRVDFELLGLGVFGEADGQAKYTASPDDPSARRTHYNEKRRENWITGSTGKRMIRWGFADVDSIERFARRLRAFGVAIPRQPPW